jgi:protein-S-isoprenylcysteine O-methyltransferase Ste14
MSEQMIAELRATAAFANTLTRSQKWIGVLTGIALFFTMVRAPYVFTAHSELDRLRYQPVHRVTGVVYAPLGAGAALLTARVGPTWLFENASGVDFVDAVRLDVARLASWWLVIITVAAAAILASKRQRGDVTTEPGESAPTRSLRYLALPALLVALSGCALTTRFFGVDHGVWKPRHTVGLILFLPSCALWLLARYQLGSAFTARAEARSLVTDGVYARIRNPIYVAAELMSMGLAIFLGWWFLLGISVISIPMQVRRARREARVLEAAFGDRYRAHRARTWF